MPVIQPIEERVLAQGVVGARASGEDFGASVGQALQGLGGAINQQASMILEQQEIKDTTQVHINAAEDRKKWTETLQARANAAKPGDDSFVAQLDTDMKDYFTKAQESATTRKGKQLYAVLGANMASEFGQRGIAIQSELDAKEAALQHAQLHQALGSAVYTDPTQAQAAIQQGEATIDDPKSIYARVPQATRDQFKEKLKQDLSEAALKGFIRDNPFGFLGMADPKQLEQFKPYEKLLKANVVPGGRLDISPDTQAKAPEITTAAATEKVNPNVAMALADLGASDPKTLAKDMGALLDKTGGDYAQAIGAYHMGTLKMDAVVEQFGSNWQSNIPLDTQLYIDKAMTKAGLVPADPNATFTPEPPPESMGSRQPIRIQSQPLMNNLTWEQQDRLFSDSLRLAHLQLGMAKEARQEAEYQRTKEQEGIMNTVEQTIFRPQEYGRFDGKALWANTTLTPQQKEHLQGTFDRRQRELRADHESKQNPAEVRRLDKLISEGASFQVVSDSYYDGKISFNERNALMQVSEQLRTGDSAGFGAQAKTLKDAVYAGFTNSLQFVAQKDKAVAAYYNWWWDFQKQVAEKRSKGEDVRSLVTPGSKDYVGSPERLRSFMSTPAAAVADTVQKTVSSQKKALPTYKDFGSLKSGESFTDPQGNIRVKP